LMIQAKKLLVNKCVLDYINILLIDTCTYFQNL